MLSRGREIIFVGYVCNLMDIHIKIKDPLLRAFLTGLFRPEGDGYVADRSTFVGTYLCAVAKPTDIPPKTGADKTSVKICLPRSNYNDPLRGRFLVVTPEEENHFNALLRQEFDTTFISYISGKRVQGLQLKDIIWMFACQYRLDELLDGDVEMLKKRYYRWELKELKKIRETLRQRAYYLDRKVRKNTPSGLNYMT